MRYVAFFCMLFTSAMASAGLIQVSEPSQVSDQHAKALESLVSPLREGFVLPVKKAPRLYMDLPNYVSPSLDNSVQQRNKPFLKV